MYTLIAMIHSSKQLTSALCFMVIGISGWIFFGLSNSPSLVPMKCKNPFNCVDYRRNSLMAFKFSSSSGITWANGLRLSGTVADTLGSSCGECETSLALACLSSVRKAQGYVKYWKKRSKESISPRDKKIWGCHLHMRTILTRCGTELGRVEPHLFQR